MYGTPEAPHTLDAIKRTLYPLFCMGMHEHTWIAAGYGAWGMETYLEGVWSGRSCGTRMYSMCSASRQRSLECDFSSVCIISLLIVGSLVGSSDCAIKTIRLIRLMVMSNETNIARSRFAKQLTSCPSSNDRDVSFAARTGWAESKPTQHYSSPDKMLGKTLKRV